MSHTTLIKFKIGVVCGPKTEPSVGDTTSVVARTVSISLLHRLNI